MGYGGSADPCTLSITNDVDAGHNKDPSMCNNGVLILWDEPYTQADRGQGDSWRSPQTQASQWKSYVDRWSSQLAAKRAGGMMVTTPMFTNGQPSVQDKMNAFFDACGPDCSSPDSPYYIDVLIWNAFTGPYNHGDFKGAGDWIKGQAGAMKSAHGNRQVWLGNFAYIGPDANPQLEIDVMYQSGVYDPDGSIDAVYYFAATDYGGGSPRGVNFVTAQVGDTTIGHELMKICSKFGSDLNVSKSRADFEVNIVV